MEKLEEWLKIILTNDFFCHLELCTKSCGPQTSIITWEHVRHTESQARLQTCFTEIYILTGFASLSQYYALSNTE